MARICVSQSRGCWVDLYEMPDFRGKRLRLFGPADYVNLFVADDDWAHEAASAVAGPAAYVQCFEELNFLGTVTWLVPGQRVAAVGALAGDAEFDSIRLFDRPPFASEQGFDAYARAQGEGPPPLKLSTD